MNDTSRATKRWHIAYTRFRVSENGSFVYSRPVATAEDSLSPNPRHRQIEDVLFAGKPLPKRDVSCWRHMECAGEWETKGEALAALARFPVEEWTLAGQAGRKFWLCPDGREVWEPRPSEAELRLDPMYAANEQANAQGGWAWAFNPFKQVNAPSAERNIGWETAGL